jgi:uncharacterized protein (DUF427 family)
LGLPDATPPGLIEEAAVADYPSPNVETDHIEPAPRRVRGYLNNAVVFDTIRALYVWEWPAYPQYYIPFADIDRRLFIDEDHEQKLRRGTARRHGLRSGDVDRPGTAWLFGADALEGLDGMVRFDWRALDAWYEEDEQIFGHPRSPYSRVDALRSRRLVRVELDGVVLAESASPVMVFETGLPTRYYLERTSVNFEHLRFSDTQTACPYKGRTTGYWTAVIDGHEYPDLAWTYDFPTYQLSPIAGLIAFYNEKVDIFVDGVRQERPRTQFS